MTWVLGAKGVILYKAMWTAADGLRAFLAGFALDRPPGPGQGLGYTEQAQVRQGMADEFFRLLERNGPRAPAEFRRAMEIWTARAKEARRNR